MFTGKNNGVECCEIMEFASAGVGTPCCCNAAFLILPAVHISEQGVQVVGKDLDGFCFDNHF